MKNHAHKSEEGEREALRHASRLMFVSVRTAPMRARPEIRRRRRHPDVVVGREKEALADARMRERDAKNLRDSEAAVLIGVRGTRSWGMNCGACGHATCSEFDEAQKKGGQDFMGPTCIAKALDLGIALGSAVKTASLLNVDNRIMYRIGTTVMRLNLLPEAIVVMGIPVSAKGKNIFFDRKR